MSDGNDFLMRGGVPSVKFPHLGSSVVGVVTKPIKVVEVTDPRTKEVKRWPNGDPKMQVIIELQTELRESEDDTGERTLWAKGQMQNAIRDAVRNSGAKGIAVGGIIQVVYAEEKPTDLQAQKIYRATYWPPEQAPQQIPASPWDQPAAPTYSPAPAPQTPWQQAEARQAAPVQATVAARPVSTPPAPAPEVPQGPFLDRLRQISANQQAHQQQRQGYNHRGEPQDVEPPY